MKPPPEAARCRNSTWPKWARRVLGSWTHVLGEFPLPRRPAKLRAHTHKIQEERERVRERESDRDRDRGREREREERLE